MAYSFFTVMVYETIISELWVKVKDVFDLGVPVVTVQTVSPAKPKSRPYVIMRDMRAPKRILSAFCVHFHNGSVPCLNCHFPFA